MDGLLHTIQINHNSPGCIAGLSGSVLNLWTPYIMLLRAELRGNCRANFRTIQQVQLILLYLSSKYSSLALLEQARGCKNCVTSKSMTRHEGSLTDNAIAASNVEHGYFIFNCNCSMQAISS